MANPRNTVSFNELDLHTTTFINSGLVATDIPVPGAIGRGPAVGIVADSTVGKGAAGGRLFGQGLVLEKDLGFVTVQDEGFITVLYSGTAPAVGAAVELAGDGTVRAATSTNIGNGNYVVSVNTTATEVVVKLS